MTAPKITRVLDKVLTDQSVAMNNSACSTVTFGHGTCTVTLQDDEVCMQRAEQDLILYHEDIHMKKIVAAATFLVARLDRVSLPGGAAMAALTLAGLIEGMPKAGVNDFRGGKPG